MADTEITEPTVTANSQLLLGALLGAFGPDNEMYVILDYDAGNAVAMVENRTTGNQYELAVKQISGTP